MRGKFSFLSVDSWFDVTKCNFIMKKKADLKFWLCFYLFLWRISVADTKITFVYSFVASLKQYPCLTEGSQAPHELAQNTCELFNTFTDFCFLNWEAYCLQRF